MIRFGTDGWRAIIGDEYTFQNVKRLAQAYADNLKSKKSSSLRVAVGFDTRFLSPEFAKAAAVVLAGNGIKVDLFKTALPSPSLCLAIISNKLSGGLMITASHNPYNFNGIKIKTAKGAPASREETKRVERLVGASALRELDFEEAKKVKKIREIEFKQDYLRHLKSYVDFSLIKNKSFKIMHDSMHGAGGNLIEELFKNTKLSVDTIRGEINPSFCGISPEPIPKNLDLPIREMKKRRHDLAVVTDGDGDRIGAILPGGKFLTPGWIMALLLIHFVKNRKESGAVVKTLSNSSLIKNIAAHYELKLYETPVGFKYIAEIMQKEDVLIGGEESGGIGFKNYIPERDGILSGLLLIEMMAYENKSIEEIIVSVEKQFGRYHYQRIDIHYPENLKPKLFQEFKRKKIKNIAGYDVVGCEDYDGVKFTLKDGSWLIFRLSGTEPILRIYSEAKSIKKVKELLDFGSKFALSIK
ncbi:MAG: phosphoglucomutase/phosphomannomutase family protein [Candidatus Kaelpia aquatica]|nr:phosphoglucomutase/phosphomannomutase family protein [Candidatus Kaelpia aquatica]